MANSTSDAIVCVLMGNDPLPAFNCCSLQDTPSTNVICTFLETSGISGVQNICPSGNCINDCRDLELLYGHTNRSIWQYSLYDLCLFASSIVGYLRQGLLSDYAGLDQYFPPNTTNEQLQDITAKVTHCLISTCDVLRNITACFSQCSPSALLINSTFPSAQGVFDCLDSLCGGLPYGNADIVGIGVFASYISQCTLVLLIWIGFVILNPQDDLVNGGKKFRSKAKESLITGLVEFHKAQCFFSIALQVASLVSGVFHTDLLNAFTLLPLSTNSILPIVFTLLFIVRYGRSSTYLLALTTVAWTLATISFWGLYKSNPGATVEQDGGTEIMAETFIHLLSDIFACGGYSALAYCPNADYQINILPVWLAYRSTPFIWTWSTLVLLYLLGHHILHTDTVQKRTVVPRLQKRVTLWATSALSGSKIFGNRWSLRLPKSYSIFWLSTLVFLACLGYQLYLLVMIVVLQVIDFSNWGFGQIIAILVWLPPVVEYVYLQSSGIIEGSKYRLAKNLKVVRVSHQTVDKVGDDNEKDSTGKKSKVIGTSQSVQQGVDQKDDDSKSSDPHEIKLVHRSTV